MADDITIIVPLYNEELSIPELVSTLKLFIESRKIPVREAVLVDDGSTDGSWNLIRQLCSSSEIRAIRLSQNCGKSIALQKGFDSAKSTLIATIDADLQDDPHELSKLFEELQKGADFVCAWREKRNDSFQKKLLSGIYNKLIDVFFETKLNDVNAGMKLFKKTCVEGLKLHNGLHRFIPVLSRRNGSLLKECSVLHYPRRYGVSHYGLQRWLEMLCDLIAISLFKRYRPETRSKQIIFLMALSLFLIFSWPVALAFCFSLLITVKVIDREGLRSLENASIIDEL